MVIAAGPAGREGATPLAPLGPVAHHCGGIPAAVATSPTAKLGGVRHRLSIGAVPTATRSPGVVVVVVPGWGAQSAVNPTSTTAPTTTTTTNRTPTTSSSSLPSTVSQIPVPGRTVRVVAAMRVKPHPTGGAPVVITATVPPSVVRVVRHLRGDPGLPGVAAIAAGVLGAEHGNLPLHLKNAGEPLLALPLMVVVIVSIRSRGLRVAITVMLSRRRGTVVQGESLNFREREKGEGRENRR